jgi:hypothetical protein
MGGGGVADRVSVIADVRYDRVRGYSRKYTIGYTSNTRNEHGNTQCNHIKVFILLLFIILNSFLTMNLFSASTSLKKIQFYTAKQSNSSHFVIHDEFWWSINIFQPIAVAARFKAWTVFACSNAGYVGSNSTQGMDICIMCIYSVFMLFCM